jgi:hypothetical protein
MNMSVQMEDGTALDNDRVDALIALIKQGKSCITIADLDDAIATGILDEA